MRPSFVSVVVLGLASAVIAAPQWKSTPGCTKGQVTEVGSLPGPTPTALNGLQQRDNPESDADLQEPATTTPCARKHGHKDAKFLEEGEELAGSKPPLGLPTPEPTPAGPLRRRHEGEVHSPPTSLPTTSPILPPTEKKKEAVTATPPAVTVPGPESHAETAHLQDQATATTTPCPHKHDGIHKRAKPELHSSPTSLPTAPSTPLPTKVEEDDEKEEEEAPSETTPATDGPDPEHGADTELLETAAPTGTPCAHKHDDIEQRDLPTTSSSPSPTGEEDEEEDEEEKEEKEEGGEEVETTAETPCVGKHPQEDKE